MNQDHRRLYNALTARDSRFDGVFFVGVTSTGIYCRPICRVKTPKAANCRFFDTPQEAEQAGFRPCLRCRPELAPGNAPVDDAQRIARLIVQRLEEGQLDEEAGLEAIADQFELSSRQIRRIVQKELGVPPIQLLLTRRLLLAKQLLTETMWPMTEVAFASGFSSVRRFNDAFTRHYGMPPTRLRKKATDSPATIAERETSTLQLSYRPPYDWKGILAFLAARALTGIEHVTDASYARTVQLGKAKGWIRVTQSKKQHALLVEFTHSLTPVLPALLSRVRALFDLDARPDVIAKRLRKDARLASAVKANPGLRVPGAFNGFELGLRAILGQQVTVKAATTIAGRFVEAFGEPFVDAAARTETPHTRAVSDREGERRRHRSTRNRRHASAEHHRAGEGAGIRRAVPRRGRASQSRRLHQAAGGAARHRSVDGALHCHARSAVARRLPEGRHRRAQQSRWRDREGGRGAVPTLAAMAQLCGHARLGHGQSASVSGIPIGSRPISRSRPAIIRRWTVSSLDSCSSR